MGHKLNYALKNHARRFFNRRDRTMKINIGDPKGAVAAWHSKHLKSYK